MYDFTLLLSSAVINDSENFPFRLIKQQQRTREKQKFANENLSTSNLITAAFRF
jgi:hypothetical protein